MDRQPLLDAGGAATGLQLGAAEDKSGQGGLGGAGGGPHLQSSTSRPSLAAWIKSIGQWILEWVPAGGNVSLDPFLFSIGRVGRHGGGTLPDGVHERPLGVEREVSASCPPLHGLLFPFRHLEQLQPGSAGLGQGFGAHRDQPRGPSVGRPETPSGLQRDLQPPGRVHRYRAPTQTHPGLYIFWGCWLTPISQGAAGRRR